MSRDTWENARWGTCNSPKSSNISEEQAFALRMDMAKLLSCGLVSEIAVIKVHSAEGGGDTREEGK
jgi:hypothetical protein